jgi:predicted MFS family arabinose efflux permease
MVGALLFGIGVSIYRILLTSLRQILTPDALQGRVAVTALALIQGGTLAGALLSGLVGEILGLRATLLLGAAGELLAVLWLLPLLRRQP